jgi:hypothetical protein
MEKQIYRSWFAATMRYFWRKKIKRLFHVISKFLAVRLFFIYFFIYINSETATKVCSSFEDYTDSKLFKKTDPENFNFLSLTETEKGSSAQLECKIDGSKYNLSCEQSKKKHKVKIVGSKTDKKNFNKC